MSGNIIRIDGTAFFVDDIAEWAEQIYQDRKAKRPTPELTCNDAHRGRMYLRKVNGQLWAAHMPGQGGACRIRITNEGPGHKIAKDYAVRAWERHGYTAATEHRTGTDKTATRLDAAVLNAPVQLGLEAQFSPLADKDARARTTKSYNAGWTAVWLPGRNDMPLARYHAIPMVRPHTDIAWAAGLPKPGTVAVASKRAFVMEPCTVRGRFDRCPVTGRGMCGQYHPFFPAPEGGFDVLDEVLGELAAGLTVTLMDAKGVVRLVSDGDFRRYEEATGLSGVYRPASVRPATVAVEERTAVPCTSERTPNPDTWSSRTMYAPRAPIAVRDAWSAAAERDRQYGEARRARLRSLRLDAYGFVVRGEAS